MKIVAAIAIGVVGLSSSLSGQEARIWTNSDGLTVAGDLSKIENEKVTIIGSEESQKLPAHVKLPVGRTLTVDKEKLSKKDKDYLGRVQTDKNIPQERDIADGKAGQEAGKAETPALQAAGELPSILPGNVFLNNKFVLPVLSQPWKEAWWTLPMIDKDLESLEKVNWWNSGGRWQYELIAGGRAFCATKLLPIHSNGTWDKAQYLRSSIRGRGENEFEVKRSLDDQILAFDNLRIDPAKRKLLFFHVLQYRGYDSSKQGLSCSFYGDSPSMTLPELRILIPECGVALSNPQLHIAINQRPGGVSKESSILSSKANIFIPMQSDHAEKFMGSIDPGNSLWFVSWVTIDGFIALNNTNCLLSCHMEDMGLYAVGGKKEQDMAKRVWMQLGPIDSDKIRFSGWSNIGKCKYSSISN